MAPQSPLPCLGDAAAFFYFLAGTGPRQRCFSWKMALRTRLQLNSLALWCFAFSGCSFGAADREVSLLY